MSELLDWLISDARTVDIWIKRWFKQKSEELITVPILLAAMEYACLNGGKRVRAGLVCASNRMASCYFNKNSESAALAVAAAVELLHSYSLIHDDLPAMDDSDLRRGKKSTHKEFDEATAILAGDALQTAAFEILTEQKLKLTSSQKVKLVSHLSVAAGVSGMAGGQMLDLEAEAKFFDIECVRNMQLLKTGSLITASVVMGGVVGGADNVMIKALSNYSENLGIAFQIKDDLLDYQGSTSQLGKPVQQDNSRGKASYIEHYGVDGASKKAKEFVEKACDSLQDYEQHAKELYSIAKLIIKRTY